MTKEKEIYKCEICGNIVEVVNSGVGVLVCCGKEMTLMEENIDDSIGEKHKPIIRIHEDFIEVEVGEKEHPMVEEHYIKWIELENEGIVERKFLKPGQKPKARFGKMGGNLTARAYCNKHGLWRS